MLNVPDSGPFDLPLHTVNAGTFTYNERKIPMSLQKLITTTTLAIILMAMAHAQTLDSILAKNVAARGGLDKIRNVQTMQWSGKMTMMGMDLPVSVFMKRPSSVRTEVSIQSLKIISAYDGKNGWMINPMMGSKEPMDMPPQELQSVIEQADMDGILVDWKTKGHKVDFVGMEKIDSVEAFHLKVMLQDTIVRHVYLDAVTYLEIEQRGMYPIQGKTTELETAIGGYRNVEGMMFPFTADEKAEGKSIQKTTFDSLQLNVPIPDSLFARPAAKSGTKKK